ncbi:MAG: hypothetical protein ACPHWZ_02575 [Longimicrobiales bacterium]
MKVRLLFTAMATMSLTLAAPTSAVAQVAGTWTLSTEGPRGPLTMTLVLEVERDGLEGTLTMQRRGGGPGGGGRAGGGPPETALSNGAVEGDSFSFSVTMSMRGNSITQEFTGSVDGDEMSGTITTPRGERPFSGTRSN